ncbi:hypothetical protein F53441_6490 [Fusarium austroafricanum]|uniref:MARVEL domain-containing protein n=1 Tax=Fusarium austroafricanum TaxID=2364996 RepID=A0A8H4KHP9_9HYPO|nr:hypothetical protein F53441_6490 [Fusarium austroafricanum]
MASRRPDPSQYPTGLSVLRIFQAVLNIITIVVASFTISAVVLPGNALLITTSSASLLVSLWMAFAHMFSHRLFNFLAALILDTILTIFWIISVAVLASQTAVLWAHGTDYCENNNCPDNLKTVSKFSGYVFATCCGLGAVGFLFSCICLVFHGVVSCRQHRYNQIGVNRVSEPIDIIQKHPQGSTEYQPLA